MSGGALSSDWAPSFAAVPRAPFLPELIWPFDMETGQSVPVSRATDPGLWYRYAESDVPLVTQWDDGKHSGPDPGVVATSSASMPSVVFRMLQDLDVQSGNRVLEIGTGTGWNAALLAHRLGAENVTTIDVDPAISADARTALTRFGLPVHVIHGDGLKGHPEGGPYDRIIATCGLRSIPFAWVEQCRPDGVVVAPWGTHYGNGDAVARLTVSEDGASASGAFTGPVEFMKARAQRLPSIVHADYLSSAPDRVRSSTTILESDFIGERFDPLRFALGVSLRECVHVAAGKHDGKRPVWLYGLTDRSWACAVFHDGSPTRVWQAGPRRLWDEAESAYRWWNEQGKPGFGRFGLTVTADAETVWLDDPENPVPARHHSRTPSRERHHDRDRSGPDRNCP
ncbi:protein-L-isoaspartate(D-aspartate) O-methyltransferase [Streptomyces sp. V2]|uniref:methyltransferase domain-containing protein n=1 Tax=Streptomyces sp. V2 TaxID=1424099 RepID=UPI000D66F7F6|nr:methyltransferase domain-containing protein [Streptomyces sp. V2]PWG14682.1 protein-L-isoaspartate(D-aspartate) O-methyltransferase [Streptomyces sp. V2]